MRTLLRVAFFYYALCCRSGKKPKGVINLDDCEQVDVGLTVEGGADQG